MQYLMLCKHSTGGVLHGPAEGSRQGQQLVRVLYRLNMGVQVSHPWLIEFPITMASHIYTKGNLVATENPVLSWAET